MTETLTAGTERADEARYLVERAFSGGFVAPDASGDDKLTVTKDIEAARDSIRSRPEKATGIEVTEIARLSKQIGELRRQMIGGEQ